MTPDAFMKSIIDAADSDEMPDELKIYIEDNAARAIASVFSKHIDQIRKHELEEWFWESDIAISLARSHPDIFIQESLRHVSLTKQKNPLARYEELFESASFKEAINRNREVFLQSIIKYGVLLLPQNQRSQALIGLLDNELIARDAPRDYQTFLEDILDHGLRSLPDEERVSTYIKLMDVPAINKIVEAIRYKSPVYILKAFLKFGLQSLSNTDRIDVLKSTVNHDIAASIAKYWPHKYLKCIYGVGLKNIGDENLEEGFIEVSRHSTTIRAKEREPLTFFKAASYLITDYGHMDGLDRMSEVAGFLTFPSSEYNPDNHDDGGYTVALGVIKSANGTREVHITAGCRKGNSAHKLLNDWHRQAKDNPRKVKRKLVAAQDLFVAAHDKLRGRGHRLDVEAVSSAIGALQFTAYRRGIDLPAIRMK